MPVIGYWMLVGLEKGKTIAIEEAEKHAMQQPQTFRTDLLTLLSELKSAVHSTLIGEIVENGRLITLRLNPAYHKKLIEIEPRFGFSAKVTSTEPSGLVKVLPDAKIKILLHGV